MTFHCQVQIPKSHKAPTNQTYGSPTVKIAISPLAHICWMGVQIPSALVYFWQRQGPLGQPADGLGIPNDLTPRWVCWQALDQNYHQTPPKQLSHILASQLRAVFLFRFVMQSVCPLNGGDLPKFSRLKTKESHRRWATKAWKLQCCASPLRWTWHPGVDHQHSPAAMGI